MSFDANLHEAEAIFCWREAADDDWEARVEAIAEFVWDVGKDDACISPGFVTFNSHTRKFI